MAPDEQVAVGGEPDERQPHQRCAAEVVAAGAVGGEQAVEPIPPSVSGNVRPVEDVERHRHLPEHHLCRLLQVVPDEGTAQDGVPCHEPAPGVFEGAEIERPAQHHAQLLEVGAAGRVAHGMEQQALLER